VRIATMGREVRTDTVVVVSQDQASCDLGKETVLLHLKTGAYYGLNAVGARIWNLIQEPRTVSEVRDAIVGEYDVEPERCERDVLALLKRLTREGLVEIRDESGA